MTKQEAYITEDSFGSILPRNWEHVASYLNFLIDRLPEDEDGSIDSEDVQSIWEAYCNGDYCSLWAFLDESTCEFVKRFYLLWDNDDGIHDMYNEEG